MNVFKMYVYDIWTDDDFIDFLLIYSLIYLHTYMFLLLLDDYEREQAFHLAEQLDLQLTQMENTLNQVILNYNSKNSISAVSGGQSTNVTSAGAGIGGGAGSGSNIGKIVDILNEHHTVLGWLDMKSRSLQKELQIVNRELHAVSYD